jgi:hypothetical protein
MSEEDKCVEHDFVWVYGFDVDKSKQRRAWRKLVDNMGADVIAKEFASHCEPACGGVGLMTAKFLDGTSAEVPGMLNELPTKRKAPSQSGQLKKPAAAATKAKPAPRVQDANFPAEEDAEEEEKAKGFEVNPLVEYAEGDLCVLRGLVCNSEFNSTCCKLLKQREDGRWDIELLANAASLLSAKEQNLKKLDEDDIMQYLSKSYEIGTKTYMVKGNKQRGETNLIIMEDKKANTQLGQASVHSAGCERAFREAMQIMEALQARFATSGAQPTREAFYTERDAAKGS